MKVEDVPAEWVGMAMSAEYPLWRVGVGAEARLRAALAAVIPAIQAEALKRAELEALGAGQGRAGQVIAAAIRALKEGT